MLFFQLTLTRLTFWLPLHNFNRHRCGRTTNDRVRAVRQFYLQVVALGTHRRTIFILFRAPQRERRATQLISRRGVIVLVRSGRPKFLQQVMIFRPRLQLHC